MLLTKKPYRWSCSNIENQEVFWTIRRRVRDYPTMGKHRTSEGSRLQVWEQDKRAKMCQDIKRTYLANNGALNCYGRFYPVGVSS